MNVGNEELPPEVIEFAHRLFDAARYGETEFVTSALDQGVPISLADPQGNSLVMLASYHGQAGLVSALIQRGADLNRQNDRGQTPLAGAVFKRFQDIYTLLLKHGADPDLGTPTARATAEMFGVNLFSADESSR